ncbi:MAG: hypothetical protein NTY48_04005 [Candidatus Diapherotrites archaeon]|nr:hypothetical protein [Candidatus Diapherotrites archaeon]
MPPKKPILLKYGEDAFKRKNRFFDNIESTPYGPLVEGGPAIIKRGKTRARIFSGMDNLNDYELKELLERKQKLILARQQRKNKKKFN